MNSPFKIKNTFVIAIFYAKNIACCFLFSWNNIIGGSVSLNGYIFNKDAVSYLAGII